MSHDNRTSTAEMTRTQKSMSQKIWTQKNVSQTEKKGHKNLSHDNRPSTAEMTGTWKSVSQKKRPQKTVSKSEKNGTQNFVSHDEEDK